MEQVVTINPDGSVETLRSAKGKGVDLREFGAVEMQRVSNVELCPNAQKYYVEFTEHAGVLAGRNLTVGLLATVRNEDFRLADINSRAYFDEYEDGVAAEIQVLNAVRVRSTHYTRDAINYLT